MNLIKSVFISVFVSWLALVSLFAVVQLFMGTTPALAWFGLALTAFAPLTFFLKAFLFKSPRTPSHPVEYSVASGLGLAMTMAISFRYGEAAGSVHIWAGITLLSWFAYLRWFSFFQGRHSQSIAVGSRLPVFELESLDGEPVSSESFMTKPHLLLFYRGNWCPFCTAQVEELASSYRQFESMGVNVILISPQPAKKNQALAARFNIPMTFLSDRNGAAARQLGIQHDWGTPMGMQVLGYESHSVLPTLLMTDADGQIIYSDQTDNYRVRPELTDLIDLLSTEKVQH